MRQTFKTKPITTTRFQTLVNPYKNLRRIFYSSGRRRETRLIEHYKDQINTIWYGIDTDFINYLHGVYADFQNILIWIDNDI